VSVEVQRRFDVFWSEYPLKKAKQDALRAFAKLRPDDELLETILQAVRRQKATDSWRKDNGDYIPHPATYLNGRRWEDEITQGVNHVRRDGPDPDYAN